MPMMQTVLIELNHKFCADGIGEFAASKDTFAPGNTLKAEMFASSGTLLHRALKAYFAQLPGSFHETLRGIIHYALSTTPPTQVTFAWAPSYDYELTLWHSPDTKLTKGGITVLFKSRYPDDKHPLAGG